MSNTQITSPTVVQHLDFSEIIADMPPIVREILNAPNNGMFNWEITGEYEQQAHDCAGVEVSFNQRQNLLAVEYEWGEFAEIKLHKVLINLVWQRFADETCVYHVQQSRLEEDHHTQIVHVFTSPANALAFAHEVMQLGLEHTPKV